MLAPTIVGSISTAPIFAAEDLEAAYVEAEQLIKDHWDEIAKNKELLYLNPDLEIYKKVPHLLLTARYLGNLVGYFLWIFHRLPHYQHVLAAEEDLHYLTPEHRKGMAGYLFMKYACSQAQGHGANLLVMREKIGHEHPAVMKRLGFLPTDIIYTKAV
jgi:hypothetical protein